MKMKPIIKSLTDVDFYKFNMMYFVWLLFKYIIVLYGFKNRTKTVKLAQIVSEKKLRQQLNHIRTLRFREEEISFLRKHGFYSEKFLRFLRALTLPAYQLRVVGDQYVIEVRATWPIAILWETLILSVVNELYADAMVKSKGITETQLRAEGHRRLTAKIVLLKAHPISYLLHILEFGTRRRRSQEWQEILVRRLKDELPAGMLIGTSNVFLAMTLGIKPIGTMAHELFMVLAALLRKQGRLREAQKELLRKWEEVFGGQLTVALTDTFGTPAFFQDFGDFAANWTGLRQDSGDPAEFARRAIAFYQSRGIDPKSKLLVFSDGLDEHKIAALLTEFGGQIQLSFGWGTNLTFDFGDLLQPISIVMKAIEADGEPTVKLSDNPAKATGPDELVTEYQEVFGYGEIEHAYEAPIY